MEDVPLITAPLNPDEYKQARSPEAAIYTLIEQDLLDAIATLPKSYPAIDIGRITKGAAQGLLAKMYLFRGDFPKAEQYAMEVINSNDYALYPSYTQLFQPEGEKFL